MAIEPLEDRSLLSIVHLVAHADGYSQDTDFDGDFDNVIDDPMIDDNPGTSSVNEAHGVRPRTVNQPASIPHARGLLEFDLSSVHPGAQIVSATLEGNINTYSYNSIDGGVDLEFRGYAGEGVLSTADATAGGAVVGTYLDIDLGPFAVQIDVTFVASAKSATGFAGFEIRITRGDSANFESIEYPFFFKKPTLVLTLSSPDAIDDSYIAQENSTLVIDAAAGVLDNDSDPDADPLSALVVAAPLHGTLALAADGSFDYTPAANFDGYDSFTYRAYDGQSTSRLATAAIKVVPANPPTITGIVADTGTPGDGITSDDRLVFAGTAEPGSTVTLLDGKQFVLFSSNVSGTSNDRIKRLTLPHPTSGGWGPTDFATIAGPLGLALAPNGYDLYVGTETGIVKLDVTNPGAITTIATSLQGVYSLVVSPDGKHLYASVFGLNRVLRYDLSAGTSEVFLAGRDILGPLGLEISDDGRTLFVANRGPNGNARNGYIQRYDVPSKLLTGTIRGMSGATMMALAPDGRALYTVTEQPDFFYTSDRLLRFDIETLAENRIAETGFNQVNHGLAFESADSLYTAAAGGSSITHYQLLNHQINGPVHGYGFGGSTPHGMAIYGLAGKTTADAAGNWTFDHTGTALAQGTHVFTAKAVDPNRNISPVTGSFTVVIDATAPAAPTLTGISDDTGTAGDEVTSDTTLLIHGTAPASMIVEVFQDGVSIGTTTAAANGSWTFDHTATPLAGGNYVFTAKSIDVAGNASPAAADLPVTITNSAPVAAPDDYATDEDIELIVGAPGVLANDSDDEGDDLEAILVADVEHGTLDLNADGSFHYLPDADYFGPDSFSYQASDGGAASEIVFVTIDVRPVVEIELLALSLTGGNQLVVQYRIEDGDAGPFEIGFYGSRDAAFAAGEPYLFDTYVVPAAARVEGTHSLTLSIGADVSFPGGGTPDPSEDYRLLVVADHLDAVLESDAEAYNEDNTLGLTGAYHVGNGPVMVFGREIADTISAAVSGNTLNVVVNGTTIPYALSTASELRVRGLAGGDMISAGSTVKKPAWFWGGDGIDSLTGGGGADRLEGDADNDSLTGGPGNDTFAFDTDSRLGSDSIADSGGKETLDFSATTTQSIAVNLGLTTGQTVNTNLALTIAGVQTIENALGGSLADLLTGNAAANRLEGHGGNDSLIGVGGADTLIGGAGDDGLNGGGGNDIYLFDADSSLGADTVTDSAGVDTLDFSPTQNEPVAMGLGVDGSQPINANLALTIQPGTLENAIGGGQADSLVGTAQANVLTGNGGGDTLVGQGGDDTLTGGPGDDSLDGGQGNDAYGFDVDAGQGADTLADSSGIDLLDFSAATSQAVSVDLGINGAAQAIHASNLTLTIAVGTDLEGAIGGSKNDTLTGNSLHNILLGGAGNDTIDGGDLFDLVFGGKGLDSLHGAGGEDILIDGTTKYDANFKSLRAVLAAWTAGGEYATRVGNLRAGVGGVKLVRGATVTSDTNVDSVLGEADLDWLFPGPGDSDDREPGESVD